MARIQIPKLHTAQGRVVASAWGAGARVPTRTAVPWFSAGDGRCAPRPTRAARATRVPARRDTGSSPAARQGARSSKALRKRVPRDAPRAATSPPPRRPTRRATAPPPATQPVRGRTPQAAARNRRAVVRSSRSELARSRPAAERAAGSKPQHHSGTGRNTTGPQHWVEAT